MDRDEAIRQELINLRAMGEVIANRATQLEKKLFPISGGAARKGSRKNKIVEAALLKRRMFIAKNAAK